jgi:hypothetical protein
MENKIKRNNSDFNKINLVDKTNFHLMLDKFTKLIYDEDLEYIFFNLEFSNLKKDDIEFSKAEEYNEALAAYINKLNQIYEGSNNEIIYTEFLFCLKNNKYETFIVPSLKFHKFKEESLLNIKPETIQYLEFLKTYPFEKVCNNDTLSYMNRQEMEKVKNNYEKILLEGKPTKRENKKSYYFFPKLLISPTKQLKEDVMKVFETVYNHIVNDLKSEDKNVKIYPLEPIQDFFILEKLKKFKWMNYISPYENKCIQIILKSCNINIVNDSEGGSLIVSFREFINQLTDFIRNENLTELIIDNHDNEADRVYNLLSYLQLISNNKLYLILNNNKIVKRSCEYDETVMVILEKLLLNEQLTTIPNIEKEIIFEICSIFSPKLLKHLRIEYIVDLLVDNKEIEKIEDIEFDYDVLFTNKLNEKRILFSEYKKNIDKTVNSLIYSLNNEITTNPNIHNKIYNIYVDQEIWDDIKIITSTEYKKEFSKLFEDLSIRALDPVINKDKNNKIKYKRHYIEFIVNNNYIDNIRNYEYSHSIKDKLKQYIVKTKRENRLDEEFGIMLFFDILFRSDTKAVLIGMNLLNKFYLILKELILLKIDVNSFKSFIFETIKPRFLELTLVDIDSSVMAELIRTDREYITHKMLSYFLKRQSQSTTDKVGYLSLKYNQSIIAFDKNENFTKLEKRNTNSIIIPKEIWLSKRDVIKNAQIDSDYLVNSF